MDVQNIVTSQSLASFPPPGNESESARWTRPRMVVSISNEDFFEAAMDHASTLFSLVHYQRCVAAMDVQKFHDFSCPLTSVIGSLS